MYSILRSRRHLGFLAVLTMLLCSFSPLAMAKPSGKPAAKVANWVSFAPPDKSFTATVPAAPKQTMKGSTNLWTSQADKKSIYLFGFTNIKDLKKMTPANRKKTLTAFIDSFQKLMKIKETSRKDVVSKKKIQGTETTGSLSGLSIDTRYLAVTASERIYVLICEGKTDSDRFFEGFRAATK